MQSVVAQRLRAKYIQQGQIISQILSTDTTCTYSTNVGVAINVDFKFNLQTVTYQIRKERMKSKAYSKAIFSKDNFSEFNLQYVEKDNQHIFYTENEIENDTIKLKIILNTKRNTLRFEYELISKVGKCTSKNIVFGTVPIERRGD